MSLLYNKSLKGSFFVDGDTSISHRAIMLGAIAEGITTIKGFLKGEDCLSTIQCFKDMGIKIEYLHSEIDTLQRIKIIKSRFFYRFF